MSAQLDTSAADARQWKPVRVLVEAKCRLHTVQDPPPLYDQIQLCTYMIMKGCQIGDLIQAVTITQPYSKLISSGCPLGESSLFHPSPSTLNLKQHSHTLTNKLSISRVQLYGLPYCHGEYWVSTVLPTLRSFVRAVLRVRADDSLRYSWLLAMTQSQSESVRPRTEILSRLM